MAGLRGKEVDGSAKAVERRCLSFDKFFWRESAQWCDSGTQSAQFTGVGVATSSFARQSSAGGSYCVPVMARTNTGAKGENRRGEGINQHGGR